MGRVQSLLADMGEDEVTLVLNSSYWELLRRPNFGRKSLVSLAIWAWREGRISTARLKHLSVGQKAQRKAELSASEFDEVENAH